MRCTDDGVLGKITWANATSVKIKWDDGEMVTWRRDELAGKPIEILTADDEQPAPQPETATAEALPAPEQIAPTETTSPEEEAGPEQANVAEPPATDAAMIAMPEQVAEAPATEPVPPATEQAAPEQAEGTTPALAIYTPEVAVAAKPKRERKAKTPAEPKEKKVSALDAAARVLAEAGQMLICGRQGNDFAEDDDTGEMKNLGYKMRAEGETAYEPDILLRLESHKAAKRAAAIPTAVVEKDRTGVLSGKTIAWPTFANLAQPLLGLLGTTQTVLPTDDEVGIQDAEALARQEREQAQHSVVLAGKFTARLGEAATVADLQRIGAELTTAVKAQLAAPDLNRVRKVYGERLAALKAPAANGAGSNGS